MSEWMEWVLDATSYPGVPVFCPVEPDGTVIVGMNLIGFLGKGRKVVGVFHPDGPDAVDAWWVKHEAGFKALQEQFNV